MKEINYSDSKIVVVDDREEVLNSIKNALEFENMKVKIFKNPEEGLEYLKENKDDVLLLDYFMPEMNGKEFVQKLRQYNSETIIILQTGYADKIPPMEMIDMMNIQGYIDKNEGNEKLVLTTKSAIKTAKLFKKVKEQENIIEIQKYRNQYMGKFLYRFIGEVDDRVIIIGGLLDSVTINRANFTDEEITKYTSRIKEGIENLRKIVEILELENILVLSASQLANILESLFTIKLSMSGKKLNISYEKNNIIDCKTETIIYILVEIIETLLLGKEKEINIVCEENQINIENSLENVETIEKIKKLFNEKCYLNQFSTEKNKKLY